MLATTIIGGVAGGWWHIKRMTEVKTRHEMELNVVKAELWWREKQEAAIRDALAERDRQLEEISRTRIQLDEEVEEIKNEDETVREFLDTPVPERLRPLLSPCRFLGPDSCIPAGGGESGTDPSNEG